MAADELTLPDNLETARAMLSDPNEVARWLQARRFPELQDRYNEMERPALPQQIADILEAREAANGTVAKATREAMDAWLSEHGMKGGINRPALSGADDRPVLPRNKWSAQMDAIGFANLGDFAKEIWHRNTQASRLGRINDVMNAYSGVDPAAGGYLIPESFDSEIRSLTLESSIVRSRATVISMPTPQMLFPFVDWTTNVGSTFGGWTVSRVPEGGDITESTAKFGRVKLDATKQAALAEVPNELFADATALDGFIRTTLPQSVAFAEDVDFLTGVSGGSGPEGVLNSPAAITVTKETGQPNGTIVVDNILKMYARMVPSSKGNAIWLVNPTTFTQLQQLSIAVGTGGAPVMLMNLSSGPTPTILGRPVIESEKVPALGAAADVSFLDLRYYLIGDRPGGTLESSPHQKFSNDVTLMKLTNRNDGRSWIRSAFQPLNGDTLSPFVKLGARS
jgi:HK97 family phage major capsid protein